MFFFTEAPPPVSFSREVAPIMAMHCNGCHGMAGGLSTRSFSELLRGGNLGKLIVPGDARRSLLLDFLEGRRGERHRMPKDGHALSAAQIDTVRRWIDAGAQNDFIEPEPYRITLAKIDLSQPIRILCKVDTQAYLEVKALNPKDNSLLWSEVASLKSPKEGNDAGEPGEKIWWDLRAAPDWPREIALQLEISYSTSDLSGTEFYVRPLEP